MDSFDVPGKKYVNHKEQVQRYFPIVTTLALHGIYS